MIKKKYKLGVQHMTVPPAVSNEDVTAGTLAAAGGGASIGMSLGRTVGSFFGPVGSAVGMVGGALFGGLIGGIKGNENAKRLQRVRQETIDSAERQNNFINETNVTQGGNELYQQNMLGIFENGGIIPSIPVEVERNELIFRPNGQGSYKLVADYKNGKKHEDGGEPYNGQEGDIVFPAKMRKRVENLLDDNRNVADKLQFEALVSKLPKDSGMEVFKKGGVVKKYALGGEIPPTGSYNMDEIRTREKLNATRSLIGDTLLPSLLAPGQKLPTNKAFGGGSGNVVFMGDSKSPSITDHFGPDNMQPLYRKRPNPEGEQLRNRNIDMANQTNKFKFNSKKGIDAAAEGILNAVSLIPSFSNLAKSQEDIVTQQSPMLKLTKQQYSDLSDPVRAKILAQERMNNLQSAGMLGGNPSALIANARQNRANAIQQTADVNNYEVGRKMQIDAANVGIQNQQDMYNNQLAQQDMIATQQNEARRLDFRNAAMEGFAGAAQSALQSYRTGQKDAKLEAVQKDYLNKMQQMNAEQVAQMKDNEFMNLLSIFAGNPQAMQWLLTDERFGPYIKNKYNILPTEVKETIKRSGNIRPVQEIPFPSPIDFSPIPSIPFPRVPIKP